MYRTARTRPLSRVTLLAKAERFGVAEAARQMGVSRQTVYRWRRRKGQLEDRPCRPAGRQIGSCGALTGTACASSSLKERPRHGVFVAGEPGEVVQIDVNSASGLARGGGRRHEWLPKRLRKSQGVGWQQVHVAIDAASRRGYLEFLPGLGAADCSGFVRRAVASFDAHGIRVRRVRTDNGTGYQRRFGEACAELGIVWTPTRPCHPWTNGRVGRFNRTLKRECLHGGEHFTSDEERRYHAALWIAFYNSDRPHTALGGLSPDD